MNNEARQALWNSSMLVANLEPGQSISREEIIDALLQPVPKMSEDGFCPSDQQIIQIFRRVVLLNGLLSSNDVVTYSEAARLSDSTEEAIRQAVTRGRLRTAPINRHGRTRSGVTLESLAIYKNWDCRRSRTIDEEVVKLRRSEYEPGLEP